MITIKYEKTNCDVYHFKIEQCLWATFFVRDNGQLSIMSDYGDWNYWWHSFGDDFKAFLCGLGDDYIMDKLSCGKRELNFNKTIQNIKDNIVECRNSRDMDSDLALACWDEIEALEYCDDIDLFYAEMLMNCPDIMNLVYDNNASELPISREYCYHLKAFVDKFWPMFTNKLKEDE
jgi:hypothetical protein